MESAMKTVRHGRYVLLPIDEHTRGHGTHTLAALWKHHLADFLRRATADYAGNLSDCILLCTNRDGHLAV